MSDEELVEKDESVEARPEENQPREEEQWREENQRLEEKWRQENIPPAPPPDPVTVFEVSERPHRSFIFPILLIALGVLFLLRNTGAITGDVWDLLVRLWPLLLVAIGLDSLLKREGLAGSVFWLGLGGVLLLANLGVLAFSVWSVLINLWPLLLIAIGLDLVLGRRSLAGGVIASVIMLVLVGGSLWFLAFGQGAGSYQDINYPVEGASQGKITLNPAIGSLRLGALDQNGYIIQGLVYQASGEQVTPAYRMDGNTAQVSMTSEGFAMFAPSGRQARWNWDLNLNPNLPLDLDIDMGLGEVYLDLRELQAERVDLNMGLGSARVWLPAQGGMNVRVEGGIGETVVIVPAGAAVRLRSDMGLAAASVPESYTQRDDVYTSPGYDQVQTSETIEIFVNQGIGRFVLREE